MRLIKSPTLTAAELLLAMIEHKLHSEDVGTGVAVISAWHGDRVSGFKLEMRDDPGHCYIFGTLGDADRVAVSDGQNPPRMYGLDDLRAAAQRAIFLLSDVYRRS